MKRLVLVGGGHAHVEVLRRFGLAPGEEAELVLVSPDRFTAYSGMLPGLVAGHYTFQQSHIDLQRLAQFARARLVQDVVVALNPDRRMLTCDSGLTIPYDLVSIDIGAAPTDLLRAKAEQAGIPVKPVNGYLAEWEQVLQSARQRPLEIVVVGGGAGGVEITLAMQHRLSRVATRNSVGFTIVSASDRILPGHTDGVRQRMQQVLDEREVRVRVSAHVARVEEGAVVLESGERVEADRTFEATGARASSWLGDAGLATDDPGFVLIDDNLQSVSHPDVFAAGDCATMQAHPRPKSGVYAVRQGPPLADNLRQRLAGRPLQPYVPQPRALYLISTGDKYAIASYAAVSIAGAWVWRWKDHIDRKFMRRYQLS